jgi:hypothetical protein
MRLPRVRFTVRRMMIAVAVGSIACAAIHWIELRGECRREAQWHEGVLEDLETIRTNGFYPYCSRGGSPVTHLEYNEATAPLHARLVAHHDIMRRKYERAARWPWLPVEPDPPEPE